MSPLRSDPRLPVGKYTEPTEPKTFQITKWKPVTDAEASAIRLGWAASLTCRSIRTEEHFCTMVFSHGARVQAVALFREGAEALSYEGRRMRRRKENGHAGTERKTNERYPPRRRAKIAGMAGT